MVLGPNEQPLPANASIANTKQTTEALNNKQSLNEDNSLSRMVSMDSLLDLLRKLKPIGFVSTETTTYVHGVRESASIFVSNLSTITRMRADSALVAPMAIATPLGLENARNKPLIEIRAKRTSSYFFLSVYAFAIDSSVFFKRCSSPIFPTGGSICQGMITVRCDCFSTTSRM